MEEEMEEGGGSARETGGRVRGRGGGVMDTHTVQLRAHNYLLLVRRERVGGEGRARGGK